MIAWSAVVVGINSTSNAGNFTLLHLMKLLPALLVLLIPNTTADHAIIAIYICVFVDQKFFLNSTLAIGSPFQTFAVGLLVKFID